MSKLLHGVVEPRDARVGLRSHANALAKRRDQNCGSFLMPQYGVMYGRSAECGP
jgi:hypothetical protein